MKQLIGSLLGLSLLVVTPVVAESEHHSAHEAHENPLSEMGQVITCQAMHLVLSHLDLEIAVGASLDGHTPEAVVTAHVALANAELQKAKNISKVEREALTPTLLARGLSQEVIDKQTGELLENTVNDISSVIHNVAIDPAELRSAIILLQGQSSACDKFVAETDAHHTI